MTNEDAEECARCGDLIMEVLKASGPVSDFPSVIVVVSLISVAAGIAAADGMAADDFVCVLEETAAAIRTGKLAWSSGPLP
jgi:hypothetical protein